MDRQAWIAVTLCVLGLLGWYTYTATHLPPPRPAIVASPTPGTAGDNQPSTAAVPAASAAPAPVAAATPALVESVPAFAEKKETLANGDVELHLTNRGGAISEAVLLKHTVGNNGQRVVLNGPDRTPIGAIIPQPEAAPPEYTMARQGDGSVQFERKTPEGLTVTKRFFFPPTPEEKDNFVAEMAIDFRNDGAQPYVNPAYFITLGSTQPIHPNDMSIYTRLVWCVQGEPNGVDVDWFGAGGGFLGIGQHPARPFYRETVANADWAAMSNQFFTTILTPLNAKSGELWGKRIDVKRGDGQTVGGIEGAMALPGFELKPGQTNTLRVQLYTGPKLYRRLAALGHDEAEIMNFSNFTLLKLVSQALLNFMNLLHGWVGDYGFAIILLTACVKGVLWPLQNKANRSMRKMATLAPKMQELKEKYKDDPTRMNQEVMKLYKQHGVNPVGGCLPMLIQIPVFFGLFNMLGQVAELRNASFLWVKDLSQPDTVAEIPGLGWDINILPILMGATNVWLMHMTPKTGDAMQRRVLMFMPLIFLIFCYNFAAALALYYTTQNLFTILQLWHNQRQPLPVEEKVAAPPGKKSRKGRS